MAIGQSMKETGKLHGRMGMGETKVQKEYTNIKIKVTVTTRSNTWVLTL
jgi:hypothetical protein